jgi:hypothetical protein
MEAHMQTDYMQSGASLASSSPQGVVVSRQCCAGNSVLRVTDYVAEFIYTQDEVL